VSFSGDIQDPPGQGPVQPAVGDPALAGGLDWVTHRGPFRPRPSCDSVKHQHALKHLTAYKTQNAINRSNWRAVFITARTRAASALLLRYKHSQSLCNDRMMFTHPHPQPLPVRSNPGMQRCVEQGNLTRGHLLMSPNTPSQRATSPQQRAAPHQPVDTCQRG